MISSSGSSGSSSNSKSTTTISLSHENGLILSAAPWFSFCFLILLVLLIFFTSFASLSFSSHINSRSFHGVSWPLHTLVLGCGLGVILLPTLLLLLLHQVAEKFRGRHTLSHRHCDAYSPRTHPRYHSAFIPG